MGFGESATIKKIGIIKVDEENQMFQIKGAGKTKVGSNDWYHFTDLISYELVENDNIVTSGGVGQALIAGAAFGGAGAIAGGITKKVKTTSKEYLTALEEANSLLATLDIIAHRK